MTSKILAYANVSAWSNNGFSNYNATDLGFTSTVSSIAFGDVNDLFKNIYESVHDKNPNIREWVQQDSELKPINFISKHENVMRDAYNALVLVPTALTKLIRERLGNDVNVKDVVDKLKSNLESCASGQGNPEACANALLIDYNGQKIDFSPVLNVFKDAYATARPIETLLTSLRLSEDATIGGIPESYSGNPIKAYFCHKGVVKGVY
ncbi:MAG: hypothetical protein KatS3mg083_256 [Candidatus Dojkabacteria bacterium]|nr:MAG: hypothetical protein KatS3mg083_256 [Candidatus Dojkabacteria bacterium]